MGEQIIAEAAKGWTGPEALAIGVIGVLAVLAFAAIWRHQAKCEAAQQRNEERLDKIAGDIADIRVEMAELKASVKHLEYKP